MIRPFASIFSEESPYGVLRNVANMSYFSVTDGKRKQKLYTEDKKYAAEMTTEKRFLST